MKTNDIFKAIADPSRRQIFHALVVTGALSITNIATEFNMSRQGITKHIKILEEVGLLTIKESGRTRICEANIKPLTEVVDWAAFYVKFWDNKLDNLNSFLTDNKS